MARVCLENVCKSYDGKTNTVKNVTLEIRDKEFMVFVGPSGCGKSTTLRMIAGLEEITSGDCYIGERRVNDLPPRDRDIAMVFQNYALYPHMTVYKNMAFGLKLRHMKKTEVERRVNAAADVLGIGEYLERLPKELSGGQRQRVALGRAMVRDPAVFLLDEPLSNLDAKMRVQMRSEISDLHHRLQTTMIYVTHDQIEAMTMGDRICVMKDGVVQQVDTPRNLYDHPANLFVASFIGTPPTNFLHGILRKTTRTQWAFVVDGQSLVLPECWNEKLALVLDQPVILGVRPEYMDSGRTQFHAKVKRMEFIGAESYLYLTCGEGRMIAKISPCDTLSADAAVTLHLDLTKAHLFEETSGKTII